jgi:hypothetical protein
MYASTKILARPAIAPSLAKGGDECGLDHRKDPSFMIGN